MIDGLWVRQIIFLSTFSLVLRLDWELAMTIFRALVASLVVAVFANAADTVAQEQKWHKWGNVTGVTYFQEHDMFSAWNLWIARAVNPERAKRVELAYYVPVYIAEAGLDLMLELKKGARVDWVKAEGWKSKLALKPADEKTYNVVDFATARAYFEFDDQIGLSAIKEQLDGYGLVVTEHDVREMFGDQVPSDDLDKKLKFISAFMIKELGLESAAAKAMPPATRLISWRTQ